MRRGAARRWRSAGKCWRLRRRTAKSSIATSGFCAAEAQSSPFQPCAMRGSTCPHPSPSRRHFSCLPEELRNWNPSSRRHLDRVAARFRACFRSITADSTSPFMDITHQRLLVAAQGYSELGLPDLAVAELDLISEEVQREPIVVETRLSVLMLAKRYNDALPVGKEL